MAIFTPQPMYCCICGQQIMFNFNYKGIPLCCKECYDEYEWRKTLYIMGEEYTPQKIKENKPLNEYDKAFIDLTKDEMKTLVELIEPKTKEIGKEINIKDLEQYDGKLIWVTFDFHDITMCGTEKEYDETITHLSEEYPDSVFRVNWGKRQFEHLTDNKIPLSIHHNLIDKIYEWKENK
jgi:hypothetical protein